MRAILLVGGFGTRLRPLTANRPKSLIPLLNRPFLGYLIDLLKEAGVNDVVLAAGHQSSALKKLFPKYRFAVEPEPLGTGGAIRFGFEHFKKGKDQGPVLVFNGDVLFDLSLKDFMAFHQEKRSACTIALKKVTHPEAFGVVPIDDDGRIQAFIEKPHTFTEPSLINAGVYAMAPEIIRQIPLKKPSSVERDTFPALLKAGIPMYGFVSKGYWNDIGTHKSYMEAHHDLLTIKNSWTEKYFFRKRVHRRNSESTVFLGDKTQIARSAKLKGMVCCGRGVKIGPGAHIENSIFLDNVKVGKEAKITGAIIGAGSVIENGAHVSTGMVLGDKSRVKKQISL